MRHDERSLDLEGETAGHDDAFAAAIDAVAGQAELLAREIEAGRLDDRGGPDALRLLAHLIRAHAANDGSRMGHA